MAGLPRQIMTVEEAKVFYPLFGLGANVALIFSGRAVKYFSQVLDLNLNLSLNVPCTFCARRDSGVCLPCSIRGPPTALKVLLPGALPCLSCARRDSVLHPTT